MGSGGGGGGGGTTVNIVRYADYVEEQHASFISQITTNRDIVVNDSPFAYFEDIDSDTIFLGASLLSDFTPLFTLHETFMSGVNLDVLWASILSRTMDTSVVRNLVIAEGALLDDDIEETSIPRMQVGMRDINSVMASSYIVGRSIIEDGRTKAMAKYKADLDFKLMQIASGRYTTQLEWNKSVVGVYAELIKLYYAVKMDVTEYNYSTAAKDKLWPFTVLDFERAALGALQGAMNSKTDVAGASTTQKVISGALGGAAMGAMVGSAWNTPATATTAASTAGSAWGAGIGAALGIAAALTY